MSGVGEGSLAQVHPSPAEPDSGQPGTGLHPRGHWAMTGPGLRSSEESVSPHAVMLGAWVIHMGEQMKFDPYLTPHTHRIT